MQGSATAPSDPEASAGAAPQATRLLAEAASGERPVPRAPAPPVVARRYVLGDELGRGGYSVVYAARDEFTGREVALKWMPFGPGLAPLDAQREIATLRRLQRPGLPPGVARLLDDGLDPQGAWIAMERVFGAPFPGSTAPLAWEALRGPFGSLLAALSRVHGVGIVHGDLKPENALVDAEGRVVLMDFGLSVAGSAAVYGALPDGRYGTPEYFSPERFAAPADERSDLFAAGVMLFRALHARSPWRVADGRLQGLDPRFDPSLAPPEVLALCAALLDPEPARRPASADAALALLGPSPQAPALAALIAPRTELELRALFAGSDRLVHLPTDAARALWERTRGEPRLVRHVTSEWLRERFAATVQGRLAMTREALEELQARELSDPAQGAALGAWLARARRLAAEGRLHAAEPLLRAVVRASGASGASERTLVAAARLWLRVVFASQDQGMLDRFLYALRCVDPLPPELASLESLGRALECSRHWTASAVQVAHALPASAHPELERLRCSVRVEAARRASPAELLPAELRALVRRHGRSRDPRWRASLALWTGRLRYVQERYAQAARCYERCARLETWRSARLNALLNAASAWMEDFSLEHAMRCAADARDEARGLRLAFLEGRAEWLWRSAAGRAGHPLRPDLALVEAAQLVGSPDLVVLLAATEATFAFRHGDRESFARLAAIAREASGLRSESLSLTVLAALESALGMRAEGSPEPPSPESLAQRGLPRLALELAALSAPLRKRGPEATRWYRALAASVPERHHGVCMGVYSVRECLALLGAA